MREALKTAFNPLIASITVIGLISLPGMMTGQILGGSSPEVAIKYQVMLMLTIFVATLLSVVLTITLANRLVFDGLGNMKKGVLKNNHMG
jgi:putative ABC transport system permease protein